MTQNKVFQRQSPFIDGLILSSIYDTIYQSAIAGYKDNSPILPGSVVWYDKTQTPNINCTIVYSVAKQNISGKEIMGIVGVTGSIFSDTSYRTNTGVDKGLSVNVLQVGTIAVMMKVACKVGQYLHVKNDDGTLVFDDNKTKASHTQIKGFYVKEICSDAATGTPNDYIILTNLVPRN